MKTKLVLSLWVLLILSSCKKDTLDFSSDTFFGIKDFLKSENCDTECGEAASCEGKIVHLQGILDENNINEYLQQFRVLDEKENKYSIAVSVDTTISLAVFEKIKNWGGKKIKISGKISGGDAPTNFTCDRIFTLTLSELKDVFQ